MAVSSAVVPVSTTAALLSAGSGSAGSSIIVQAPAAATLYLGGPGVTSANGYPLAQGLSTPVIELEGPGDTLYGVLSTGTGTAAVLRVSV